MSTTAAWLAACASLVALIFLCLAWEIFLAPLKPGGSWLALKALPLLAPLFGVLRERRYTFQWSTLLIWAYVAEGATRAYTDRGMSAGLAAAEFALALAYFFGAVIWLRSSRNGR
ncbi:MAG TPA: DUF2069 domain-containing protein [Usitatibacter sp.]|nr:DUF2069 domain-containing protein [Usitatibacter sp.]